jgi:hypothetical protein
MVLDRVTAAVSRVVLVRTNYRERAKSNAHSSGSKSYLEAGPLTLFCRYSSVSQRQKYMETKARIIGTKVHHLGG